MDDETMTYLFLLNLVPLMLNDAFDTDEIVIVNEGLFTVLLFFLLFLSIAHLIRLLLALELFIALFLVGGSGVIWLLFRFVLGWRGCF